MRGSIEEIRGLGAELVAVGNGNAPQTRAFRDELGIDFPLLTDPSLRSYRAAGLRRSLAATLHPGLVMNSVRAFKKGFRQKWVQGDPWQQGGVFVLAAGGEVVFEQRSTTAGDHADPAAILAALAKIA